jgi:hypothetical protein
MLKLTGGWKKRKSISQGLGDALDGIASSIRTGILK